MRDFVEILKKVLLARIYNALKSFTGYYLSKWLGTPVWLAYPLSFSIEPTTACNLRCPECPSGLRSFTRNTGNLQKETFQKSLDLLAFKAMAITFYFQGEPFINRQLFDYVRMAKDRRLFTITSTNGHFLNAKNCEQIIQSGLDKLIVSIDGLTQETYSTYRIDGELMVVLNGMKLLSDFKKKSKKRLPQIVAQFIVFKHNEHELKQAYQLLKLYGADRMQVKTAQIYHETNAKDLLPNNPSLSRYELDQDGKLKIRNKLLNQCWRMWSSCVITWDGHVVPCCFDKDAKYKVGNINQVDDFRKIINTPEYMAFRKSLLKSRKEIDICRNCSEGTKVFAS
ncbi:MAG: radical SAM/SPASM domain-containing protein [Flavobacteriales bacterium]